MKKKCYKSFTVTTFICNYVAITIPTNLKVEELIEEENHIFVWAQ